MHRSRLILAAVLWLAAIAIAMLFDRAAATWARDSGAAAFLESHRVVKALLKTPGEYWFVLIVAAVVAVAHPLRWRAGGFVLLATLLSGANGLIKWMAGRTRPFKLPTYDAATGAPLAEPFVLSPFRGGLHGLFVGKDLSFPSGHAALAFATAAAVAMLWPTGRWRWGGYTLATVVAAERVAENAHWLSDAVAAAALGIAGVHLIRWVVTRRSTAVDPRSSGPPLTAAPENARATVAHD
jgi:membrane-associated phospholipid phosphatase